MAEYIKREALIKFIDERCGRLGITIPNICNFKDIVKMIPAVDAVEVETIKSWLYEMAINNVGCALDGDFSTACEEIISRLDGLRIFAKERTPKESEVNDVR